MPDQPYFDGTPGELLVAVMNNRLDFLRATKKAQKRDASPSPTSWCAHPPGLSRGGDDANRAQHDDVAGEAAHGFLDD